MGQTSDQESDEKHGQQCDQSRDQDRHQDRGQDRGQDRDQTRDHRYTQLQPDEWVSFPGGELEGKRPKALCAKCLAAQRAAQPSPSHSALSHSGPRTALLCFCCYRAELDRQTAIAAAGQLDTASDVRFQIQLPFEPVNRPRLDRLKADRAGARRANAATVAGPFADKRRHAQMTARRTLEQIAVGLSARRLANAESAVFHDAELQLPEAWIPFVMSPARLQSSVRPVRPVRQ